MKKTNSFAPLILETEKKIFHEIVFNKGFSFAFETFVNNMYSQNEDFNRIRQLLFEEFDTIEYSSVETYLKSNIMKQVKDVIYSKQIKSSLKITILYNMFSRTARNIALREYRNQFLKQMMTDLLNVFDPKNDYIEVIVPTFRNIYKNLICFNENNDVAKILSEATLVSLHNYPMTISKNIQKLVLANILILSWGYTRMDQSIDQIHSSLVYNTLEKKVSIDFIDQKASLIDLMKRNIKELFSSFQDFDFLSSDLMDLEYYSNNYSVLKSTVFTEHMMIDLYISIMLINPRSRNIEEFFKFKQLSIDKRVLVLNRVLEAFTFKNDELQIAETHITRTLELLKFLKWNKNIEAQGFVDYFNYVNSELIKLEKDGHQCNNTYTIGSDTKLDKEFIEEDGIISSTKEIDSEKYFAGNNSLDGERNKLVVINFGINNITEMNNEVLIYLLDTTLENHIVNMIFEKHLESIKIGTSLEEYEKLKEIIENNQLNMTTNIESLKYDLNPYIEKDSIGLGEDDKSSGFHNVIINSNKFSYKILPLEIYRYKLSDSEIVEHLNEKVRVANNLYKIEDLYYTYDQAYEIVKRDYRKDEIHVFYVVNQSEKPGFYLTPKEV